MTGKPCEKLHVIHLRCQWCFRYHYNTHNQATTVVLHGTYPDDPLLVPHIFCMSNVGGRYPLSLPTAAFDLTDTEGPLISTIPNIQEGHLQQEVYIMILWWPIFHPACHH